MAALLIGARLPVTGLLGGMWLQDKGLLGGAGSRGAGSGGLRCFSADVLSVGAPKLKVYIRREPGGADVVELEIDQKATTGALVKMAAAEVLPGVASGRVSPWRIDGDGANATTKEMTNLRATVGAELLGAMAVLVSLRPPPPGDVPFNASLGIAVTETVWNALPQRAQEMAAAMATRRKILANVRALTHMEETLVAEKAKALGVAVLRQTGGNVDVGLFKLPSGVDEAFMKMMPKGA